jgi:hypothetical protein
LRIMRAVRFATTLDFSIEDQTLKALTELAPVQREPASFSVPTAQAQRQRRETCPQAHASILALHRPKKNGGTRPPLNRFATGPRRPVYPR